MDSDTYAPCLRLADLVLLSTNAISRYRGVPAGSPLSILKQWKRTGANMPSLSLALISIPCFRHSASLTKWWFTNFDIPSVHDPFQLTASGGAAYRAIIRSHIILWMQCFSLGREMVGDNNAPCFSLAGFVWLSAQIAKMLKYNHSMGLKKPIF